MDKEIDTNVKVVDSKKQKTSKKKDSQVKNVIDVNPTLNEAKGKTVVLGWGRMNPITSGHEKLANKIKQVAKQRSATPLIYLGHSQDPKKNPLSYDDKVKLAQMAFGRNLVVKSNAKTIFQVMIELESKFDNLVLVVGADRIQEFKTLLNKYNGKDYTFDTIEVVSAGERTDPNSDETKKMTADTMSASVMRKLASQGDVETFKKGLPKKLQSNAKAIFDMVRGGMKLAEIQEELDLLGEALTMQQRRKRALTMRRYKTKIAAARKRLSRRRASMDKLKQRSRKRAIQVIRKKVAGKQGQNYKELSPLQKMVIDKKVAKRKAAIDRIAKKLLPQVKKIELQRFAAKKEEFDAQHPAFVNHEVERPKQKRFHQMRTKEGTMKIDRRFRAFKEKKSQFEEIETDLELLNIIEQVSNEVSQDIDEKYYGHDAWRAKEIASLTFKRGKYKKALDTLKDILTRKTKENSGKLPHSTGYYAATVAKQYSGVDARTLENMLEEEGGAGEWGTDKLARRYSEDTPGETPAPKKNSKKNVNEMFDRQIMNEDGRFMKIARERIQRMEKELKDKKDEIRDRARTMDTALKNRQTEEVELDEDKGSVKHHLGIDKKGSTFKHMMKHAVKHVDYDMDGDVDADDFKKTVPDEITGAEKENLTKKMFQKFKHEKQHTRKGIAFESVNEEVTQKQLDDLEKFADRLLMKFDIDVEFTRHFADRMNDDRNKPAITVSELQRLFKKIAKEKGNKIKKHGDAEAVIKDMQSDLNLPVVVNYKNGEFELINKTIMRKKNFKTTSPEVKYEEVELDEASRQASKEMQQKVKDKIRPEFHDKYDFNKIKTAQAMLNMLNRAQSLNHLKEDVQLDEANNTLSSDEEKLLKKFTKKDQAMTVSLHKSTGRIKGGLKRDIGVREYNAAESLIDKGILKLVDRSNDSYGKNLKVVLVGEPKTEISSFEQQVLNKVEAWVKSGAPQKGMSYGPNGGRKAPPKKEIDAIDRLISLGHLKGSALQPELAEAKLNELKVDIPDKKDTLDIPRHKMPQVASKDYDELVSYLSQKGLKLQKKKVKASALKPTQSNFNVDKVVGGIAKMKTMNQTKPLIVSSDNYIIDGHHRWLSVKNTGGSLDIVQANVPVKELLKHVKEFPKAFTRTIKD